MAAWQRRGSSSASSLAADDSTLASAAAGSAWSRSPAVTDTAQTETESQAETQTETQADEMPINRYVNAVFRTQEDSVDLLRQFRDLSMILDYQNKILVEILNHLPGNAAT